MWFLPQQENFPRSVIFFLLYMKPFSLSQAKWRWVGDNDDDTEKRLGMFTGVLNPIESEGQERGLVPNRPGIPVLLLSTYQQWP